MGRHWFAALQEEILPVGSRGHKMQFPTKFLIVLMAVVYQTTSMPLATQEDVEAAIAEVRDLAETDFAAEPRDAEAAVAAFIDGVRDLEPTDFSKVFD